MTLAPRRILLGAVIAATLGCAPATDPTNPATPTASSPDPLGHLRWKHRLVVAFAPESTDPRLTELRESIVARQREFDDRALILVTVVAGETDAADRPTPIEAEALRRRFDVEPGEFTALLVGLDGGEKARSTDSVPFDDWFTLIDSMPMRRAELRNERSTETPVEPAR